MQNEIGWTNSLRIDIIAVQYGLQMRKTSENDFQQKSMFPIIRSSYVLDFTKVG